MPRVVYSGHEIQGLAHDLRRQGRRVGLIPTMGALHEGHLSLVRHAQSRCDISIATIFVNPTQFGPQEDLAKYPRTLDSDLALLDSVGCDIAFVPAAEEIYPTGFSTYVEPPAVARVLEGSFRPDHFRGVCTVVLKLLNLVPSHVACFGQKDFQQAAVIQHMVRDLNLPVEIEVCPIVREVDGLALSSRNRYLSSAERQQALALSAALAAVVDQWNAGQRQASDLGDTMNEVLHRGGISRIDYATVVDAQTLTAASDHEFRASDRPAVALIACHVGTTRLIDNQLLNP